MVIGSPRMNWIFLSFRFDASKSSKKLSIRQFSCSTVMCCRLGSRHSLHGMSCASAASMSSWIEDFRKAKEQAYRITG